MGDIKFYSPVDFDDTSSGVTIEGNLIAKADVGIGTDSPGSKLQVNVGTDQNVAINSHGGVARISSYNDAVSASTPLKINSSDLRFDINNSEKARLTSNGNFGIGTTSPSADLHIYENGPSTLLIESAAANGNDTYLALKNSAAEWRLTTNRGDQITGAQGDFFIREQDSLGNAFVIKQNTGNVGIGTTSPNQKLQVSGNIAATAFLGDGSALTGIPATTPAGIANNIQYNNSGAFTGSNNFVYTHTTGRLGVGLSNPSTAVEIKNTVAPTLTITNGGGAGASTSPTIHLKRLDTVGSKLVYGPADKNFVIQNDFDTTSTSYGRIDFRTRGNQTRMRILAEGNVGIGVTPSAKLHVDGSFIAGSSTTSGLFYNRAVDTLAISNLTMLEKSAANIYIGKASTNLIFRSNNSERARFTSNGSFGVGTTSPVAKLHVKGAGVGTSKALNIENSAGTQILSVYDNGQVVAIGPGGNSTTNAAIGFNAMQDNTGGTRNTAFGNGALANNVGSSYNTAIGQSALVSLALTSGNAYNTAVGFSALGNVTSAGYGNVAIGANAGATAVGGNYTGGTGSIYIGYGAQAGATGATNEVVIGFGAVGAGHNTVTIGKSSTANTYLHGVLNVSDIAADDVIVTGEVGIGTTSPASKLHVAGGIQLADDGATASATKVGTIRYRTSGNNSYVDMCMQTGASTYAWVNIVQNNW